MFLVRMTLKVFGQYTFLKQCSTKLLNPLEPKWDGIAQIGAQEHNLYCYYFRVL